MIAPDLDKSVPLMIEFLLPVKDSVSSLDLILRTNHSIPEIPDLLNRTVLVGGKRLRPALAFLIGQSLGVPQERMAPFARAAEFTHSASLAHDDVVDNASTRRSLRTINAEATNKRAVLAGDLLLARVMVELSLQGNIDIIHDLAKVVEDLVNGEWLQIKIRGNVNVTHEELVEVSKRKTASLMSWCCVVAARLSEFNTSEVRQTCADFGENLGIAFQMMDDVIDFSIESEKDFAKDLKEGIVNYVVCDLLKSNPQHRNSVAQILGSSEIQTFPWTEKELETASENVRKVSEVYLKRAQEKLEQLKNLTQAKGAGSQQSFEALNNLLSFLSVRKN